MANDNKEIGEIVKKCKILLLDIEGTTTSISFVKDKLFPYAEENVKQFLNGQWETDDVKEAVAALRKLALADQEKSVDGVVAIPGEDASKEDQIEGLVKNVKWQMSSDRKEGALKQLQGLIWKQGYDSGDIKGHVYDDVSPALEQWHAVDGQKVYIYSSGSVQAQKLLFGQSLAGDLLRFIDGHFDTAVGAKQEATSYTAIVEKIGVQPGEILFLTDIPKEGEAARVAGLHVALISREGNAPLPSEATDAFAVVHSLAQLTASNKRKTEPQDEQPAKIPKTDTGDDVKTASESIVVDEKNPKKKVQDEEEKMEVEEVLLDQDITEKERKVDDSVASTVAITEKVTDSIETLDVPMTDIEPTVSEADGEKTNNAKKSEEMDTVEIVTKPKEAAATPERSSISNEPVTKSNDVAAKPDAQVTKSTETAQKTNELSNSNVVVTKPEDIVTKPDAAVTTKSDAIVTKSDEGDTKSDEVVTKSDEVVTKSDEVVTKSDEVLKKTDEISTKVDEVTTPEVVVTKIDVVETKVLESTEVSSPSVTKETIVETKTTEKDSQMIVDKKEEPVETKEQIETEVVKEKAKVAEETPPLVITEIEEMNAENLGDMAEIMEDLEPIVEEPPNEDMEDLQNVGEVLEKECDEILSKVQDVTNLDSIPIKPLLNPIIEETMETEIDADNNDTNDIVDRILDTELELEMKKCNEIDPSNVPEIVDAKKTEESVESKLSGENKNELEANAKLEDKVTENKELSNTPEKMDSECSQPESKTDDNIKKNDNIATNEKKENIEKEINSDTLESSDKLDNKDVIESKEKISKDNVTCNEEMEITEKVDKPDKIQDNKQNDQKMETADDIKIGQNKEKTDKSENTDIMETSDKLEEKQMPATEESKPQPTENNKDDVNKPTESTDTEMVSKEVTIENEKDKESQLNGKTTNGDTESVNVNGDVSNVEELNSRLSVENGKEAVNGSNGDSVDSEKGQGDKVEAEVSDIKVKTVATEEPRTDPIDQPTQA